MSFADLPPDFFLMPTQFTKTLCRDEYPRVSPLSPSLSQAGKVILITGTSQGIGRYVLLLPASPTPSPIQR